MERHPGKSGGAHPGKFTSTVFIFTIMIVIATIIRIKIIIIRIKVIIMRMIIKMFSSQKTHQLDQCLLAGLVSPLRLPMISM